MRVNERLEHHHTEFNRLLERFKDQMSSYIHKGSAYISIDGEQNETIPNPNFLRRYKALADSAEQLLTALENNKNNFFKNPTEKNLDILRIDSLREIKNAKKQFSKHRDLWYQIHPILRGILGLLAAITVVPAVLVELQAPNGFAGTFFKTPKTEAMQFLESFEEQLTKTNTILDELVIPTLSLS
ncbi:hypothetical protein LEWO105114_13250 [Legionella worsleiensis]|uniref:Coiled-coil protein n=2 Tax=Legionella worsleiensis TaxID=45076 RepID=A0A0W1A667_9GAMM|nr:hypothetical protein [Legionella worsleiensis]KTD76843.1 coiled-coil protein [Legionella worsleiensis]STY30718.1 coiled-coil protein [Legionella worsleiensis]